MTAGGVTIGVERRCQHRVKKQAVIVGTVELGMAVDAVNSGRHSGMSNAVAGRHTVTLQTGPVFGLVKQFLVRRTMWTVTFDASTSVNQMIEGYRMFENVRAGIIRMTILARPIESGRQHHIFAVRHRMAILALDAALMKRMCRASAELRHHRRVARRAIFFRVILNQSFVHVAVNRMTSGAVKPRTSVWISCHHGGLMLALVATGAQVGLCRKSQLARHRRLVDFRVVQMFFPVSMTPDTGHSHSLGYRRCQGMF